MCSQMNVLFEVSWKSLLHRFQVVFDCVVPNRNNKNKPTNHNYYLWYTVMDKARHGVHYHKSKGYMKFVNVYIIKEFVVKMIWIAKETFPTVFMC